MSGGDLVLVGGISCLDDATSEPIASVERLQVDADAWRMISPLPEPRHAHMAVALAEDAMLAIGGSVADEASADVLRYDGTTDEWTLVGSLPVPIGYGTAARVGEGSVLVVRGYVQGLPGAAFVSDDEGVGWRAVASPPTSDFASLVSLPDGRIAGATRQHSLLVYDAPVDTWTLELQDVLGAALLDDEHLFVVRFEPAEEVPDESQGLAQLGPTAVVYDLRTQQLEDAGFTDCRPTQGSVDKWHTSVYGDGRGRVFVSLDGWRIYESATGWSDGAGSPSAHDPQQVVVQHDGSLVVAPGSHWTSDCADAARVEIWRP